MQLGTIKHLIQDGRRLVRVPLLDDHCTIEETDFDKQLSLGVPPGWRMKDRAVCPTVGRKSIPIVRILLDCSKGQCVRFIDKDTTNLVRSNLVLTNGMSKYRARDLIPNEFRIKRHQIHHEPPAAAKSSQPMSDSTRRMMEARELNRQH